MVAPVIDYRGQSNKHSGVSGLPTQLNVLHSGECPLRGGFAVSLTEWARDTAVEASWHYFVDPIAIVHFIDDSLAAWHASEANPMSTGFEQAGYARFSRAEWLTPEGQVQIDSLGWIMAQTALRDGIPMRWLTTDQVTAITSGRDRVTKGFCTHRQIDPETRTDPGDNYPFDVLTERVNFYMGGGIAAQGSTEQDDFMATLNDDEKRRLLAAADRINGRDTQRWMGPKGELSDTNKPGYVALRSTDLHDVLSTNNMITANTDRILTAVSNIKGVDSSVIEGLREQLAAEMREATANLKVTLEVAQDPAS